MDGRLLGHCGALARYLRMILVQWILNFDYAIYIQTDSVMIFNNAFSDISMPYTNESNLTNAFHWIVMWPWTKAFQESLYRLVCRSIYVEVKEPALVRYTTCLLKLAVDPSYVWRVYLNVHATATTDGDK